MSNPLWNKKTKCPFCAGEFETTRLRSSVIRIKEKESDFGSVYEGECAYFYAVTACPHCTFAALNKDFDSLRPGAEPKIMTVCKGIRQLDRKKPDIFALGPSTAETAVKRHELAVAFMKMRAFPDLGVLAGLWLHLVWIFRLMKDEGREKAALAEAAKAYESYFNKGDRLPEHLGEPGALYLIGELNRRQGLYREAHRFFERALYSKEIKKFPRIAEMTRDMMMTAKEQMENVGLKISSQLSVVREGQNWTDKLEKRCRRKDFKLTTGNCFYSIGISFTNSWFK